MHATNVREARNTPQAIDKGRANQIPWKIVQPHLISTLALIGKVLQQPSLNEVLWQIHGTAKNIQKIQKDTTVVETSVGLRTAAPNATDFGSDRAPSTTSAQVATRTTTTLLPPPSCAASRRRVQAINVSDSLQRSLGCCQTQKPRYRSVTPNPSSRLHEVTGTKRQSTAAPPPNQSRSSQHISLGLATFRYSQVLGRKPPNSKEPAMASEFG
jgi:hypothetical protein